MRDEFVVTAVTSSGAGRHGDEGSTGQQIIDGALLNRRRIIVTLIQQDRVSYGRLQRPGYRLDEGADGFPTKAVDEPPQFVTVSRRHSLANQGRDAQFVDEDVVRLVRIGEELGDDVKIGSNPPSGIQQIIFFFKNKVEL